MEKDGEGKVNKNGMETKQVSEEMINEKRRGEMEKNGFEVGFERMWEAEIEIWLLNCSTSSSTWHTTSSISAERRELCRQSTPTNI